MKKKRKKENEKITTKKFTLRDRQQQQIVNFYRA